MIFQNHCISVSYVLICSNLQLTPYALYPNNVYLYFMNNTHTHTHTHPFNGPLSRTTRVSRYQKEKTNLDFTEARDSEWQWHQQCHMQVCTSLQTDNHASTPPLSFFTGRMPFLPPNQQRQSTEGNSIEGTEEYFMNKSDKNQQF